MCVCCPAGGFFASGFKRAFKMKDFGQTIPGHGGVTDRFDCQMIMAMFAYVYYWNYVASTEHTVGEALDVSVFGRLAAPAVYATGSTAATWFLCGNCSVTSALLLAVLFMQQRLNMGVPTDIFKP